MTSRIGNSSGGEAPKVAERSGPALSTRLALALCAVLLLLGLAGLTGSSFGAAIHREGFFSLEQRTEPRELFGIPREIRSDEWAVVTPIVRSDMLAEPAFPQVNWRIGLGQLQRGAGDIPVLDWGLAFRPLLWPLLLRSRWSLGVGWFLRSAFILLALVCFLTTLLRRPAGHPQARTAREVAGWSALAVFFSSPFCWWSSGGFPEILAFMAMSVACLQQWARASTRREGLGWSAAFGYFSACTFFVFYPPLWGPFLCIVAAALFDLRRRAQTRLVAGVALLAVSGAAAALSLYYYAPALVGLLSTAYPGNRIAHAGEMPIARLLDAVWPSFEVVTPWRSSERVLGPDPANACEAALFVEAAPLIFACAIAPVSARARGALAAVARRGPAMTALFAFLTLWLVVPLPQWLTNAALLRWTPWHRAVFPLGLLGAWLSAEILVELPERPSPSSRTVEAGAALIAFGAAFALALHVLSPRLEAGHLLPIAVELVALIAAATCLRHPRSRPLLVGAWLLPLLIANLGVTPLSRSSDIYLDAPGSAVVDAALQAEPGRLLDYSTHFGSELAGRGWRVLAATYTIPDLAMMAFLEPESHLPAEAYNRYSHVSFVLPPVPSGLTAFDAVRVAISPCSARLATLGVNHFLAMRYDRMPVGCGAAFRQSRAGEFILWSRRDPVCPFGIVKGEARPYSPLDLDFRCSATAGRETTVVEARDGLSIRIVGPPDSTYALAINRSATGEISCAGASVTFSGTHVLIRPDSPSASCFVPALDSGRSIRRLAHSLFGGEVAKPRGRRARRSRFDPAGNTRPAGARLPRAAGLPPLCAGGEFSATSTRARARLPRHADRHPLQQLPAAPGRTGGDGPVARATARAAQPGGGGGERLERRERLQSRGRG